MSTVGNATIIGGFDGGSVRLLVALVLFAGSAVALYLLSEGLVLDRLADNERGLRAFIQDRPWEAFGIAFALYAVVSVVPGTTGKAAVVGWLFGFWPALLLVVGALTVAGIAGFLVARGLLRDALRGYLGLRLTRFDRTLEQEGAVYLLTLRLLHVPFTLLNYLSGVSRVRLRTFAWTTALGLVPGTVVLVGLGSQLPSLDELLERGPLSLVEPGVLAALAALAIIPWGVRWLMRGRGVGRKGLGPKGTPEQSR